MKRRLACAVGLFLLTGAAFLFGAWYTRSSVIREDRQISRTILYYMDPMHPAYRSDKPGVAPDCGMELVPVYAEEKTAGLRDTSSASMAVGVSVSSESGRSIGIKVATVEKAAWDDIRRIPGRVAPHESKVYRINSATDGWVRKIFDATTGSIVRKDELLATFYAPEFFSAMRAYIYGLRALDRFEASRKETKDQIELTNANIESYRNGLRNLGMTEHQLDEIMRTREPATTIEVRAPAAGYVLARNVSPGQRFEKGTELYRIADLSTVWIVADILSADTMSLHAGMRVNVSAPQLGAKSFEARMASVPPRFDAATRTLQVRLEANNPTLLLRPDMFVDIEMPVTHPPSIAVPADALVDTGLQRTVYVEKGEGVFERRSVATGRRDGDRVEILKGLEPGERIVVSGTFLIDSESRMKSSRQ